MGATGAAHAKGYETAYHNPALASTIRENKLTLGYGAAVFSLAARGDGLPGRVSQAPAKGYFIGADVPIPFGGRLADRVGVALAFFTPTDVVVRGRVLYPERTQFPILADRAQSVTIRGGLGVDIGYGLRAGVGFAALAEIVGGVVVATDASGRVGTRVEEQLVATYAPTFGLAYDLPFEHLRVGATFRGTLDGRFSVIVDGSKLSSLTIPQFNISGIAQYDPAQVALEIARVEANNVLSLQAVYKRWRDFPGILEPSVVCSEGGVGACGLAPPAIPWQDTFVVRIGAEQGVELSPSVVLRGRGGAFFETSPLPSSVPGSDAFELASKTVVAVPTRYFDSSRFAITTGAGVALSRPLPPIDIDVFAQYHHLLPRTITSTGTRGESSGHIKTFGLTAAVRF